MPTKPKNTVNQVVMPAAAWWRVASNAMLCSSNDQTRRTLTGGYLHLTDGLVPVWRMVTTDSYTMLVEDISEVKTELSFADAGIIIPRATLKLTAGAAKSVCPKRRRGRLGDGPDVTIEWHRDSENESGYVGTVTIPGVDVFDLPAISGTYPDYTTIIDFQLAATLEPVAYNPKYLARFTRVIYDDGPTLPMVIHPNSPTKATKITFGKSPVFGMIMPVKVHHNEA